MDESITLDALVGHLQTLLNTLPNIPAAIGVRKHAQGQGSKPLPPSLSHIIPPLPKEYSQLPPHAQSQQQLLSYLATHILPHLNGAALSPNYYGLVTGGVTPAALLADWLVSVYDQNVCLHLPSETISTAVEVAALNQLVSLFSLPHSTWGIGSQGPASGIFTTGATASNILGLSIAREYIISHAAQRRNLPLPAASVATQGLLRACSAAQIHEIAILSALPHSSVLKAASILGLGRDSFISISSPESPTTISLDLLKRAASVPHRACILVIGTGEVNTGHFATSSVSQWQQLRTLCDQLGVWIHVDGAFGLFARLLHDQGPEYASLARGAEGIELADSITGDAHKLLNVPYDCGFFFTRHKALAETVCLNSAPYLGTAPGPSPSSTTHPAAAAANGTPSPTPTSSSAAAVKATPPTSAIQNPLNIALENSRRFRALPVHATLTAYGRAGHVDMLKRQVGLARRVVRWLLTAGREWYEVLPANEGGEGEVEETVRRTFMIVLFRARDERLNEELGQRIKDTGRVYVSGTVWEGSKATRIAVSNWQVDVQRDGELVEGVLAEVARGVGRGE